MVLRRRCAGLRLARLSTNSTSEVGHGLVRRGPDEAHPCAGRRPNGSEGHICLSLLSGNAIGPLHLADVADDPQKVDLAHLRLRRHVPIPPVVLPNP